MAMKTADAQQKLCPFCGAEGVPDPFPSASQRFSVYKFTCGTEIVYCGPNRVVEKDCRDHFKRPHYDH